LCPTAWQGSLEGSGGVEVTLRTTYARASVLVHLTALKPADDGAAQDTSHDAQAVADHQLNPVAHGKK
jgi:hypothetical protein